jgi:phage terminase small subunit
MVDESKISHHPVSQAVLEAEVIKEPKWETLFDDDIDVQTAREQWRTVCNEVQQKGNYSPILGHQIKRLVLFYVLYEVACRHVFSEGAIKKARRSKMPSHNPWFSVMRDATAMASSAEKELLVTPRRMQQNGQKARTAKGRQPRAADAYLSRPHRLKGIASN